MHTLEPTIIPGTEHPLCLECGAKMWLARIESSRPNYDRCIFECPACDYVEIAVVKDTFIPVDDEPYPRNGH
jgi:hypothetical protein